MPDVRFFVLGDGGVYVICETFYQASFVIRDLYINLFDLRKKKHEYKLQG